MSYSLKLLLKVCAGQFYKLNAGFFLFFFILFFGIVHPPQLVTYHSALITGMIGSPVFLMLVFFVWLLYGIKCIRFISTSLRDPRQSFLCHLQVFTRKRQLMLLGYCVFIQYLPVLIYSGFVIGFAVVNKHGFIAIVTVIYQAFVLLMSVWICYRELNRLPMPVILANRLLVRWPAIKKYPFYLLHYTFTHQKLSLLATKTASFFMLAVLFVLNRDEFSIRDFTLVYMTLILFHAFMVYYYVRFAEQALSFSRNLPVTIFYRWLVYALTYTMLLAPELTWMLLKAPTSLSPLLALEYYLSGVGQLLLFTAIIYRVRLRIKRYVQLIFAAYLCALLFLIIPGYVVFLIGQWTLALLLFLYSYADFEIEV